MPDTQTVKIGCRVPTGLRLRVYDWTDGPIEPVLAEIGMIELSGSGEAVSSGDALSGEGDAVYTEVEGNLWDKWFALNKGSDYLASRAVFKGNAAAKTPEQKALPSTPAVSLPTRSDAKAADGGSAPEVASDAPKAPKAP